MEIAKGSIRRNPHTVDVKYNLTPAEVVLLHAIHYKNAQGSPLGNDFAVYGEAVTIESPSKPAEDETFNAITGHKTPGTPAIPAKTHKRTNSEEVGRLKKKYANARVRLENGNDVEAFASVFGTAIMPKLPQTFDEIEDVVGMQFPKLDASPVVDTEAQARAKARADAEAAAEAAAKAKAEAEAVIRAKEAAEAKAAAAGDEHRRRAAAHRLRAGTPRRRAGRHRGAGNRRSRAAHRARQAPRHRDSRRRTHGGGLHSTVCAPGGGYSGFGIRCSTHCASSSWRPAWRSVRAAPHAPRSPFPRGSR